MGIGSLRRYHKPAPVAVASHEAAVAVPLTEEQQAALAGALDADGVPTEAELAALDVAADAAQAPELELPNRGDSTAKWRAYAAAQPGTLVELLADAGRDEIANHYLGVKPE